jgi:hypothetical protein
VNGHGRCGVVVVNVVVAAAAAVVVTGAAAGAIACSGGGGSGGSEPARGCGRGGEDSGDEVLNLLVCKVAAAHCAAKVHERGQRHGL